MKDRVIGFKEADYQRNLRFEKTAKESLEALAAMAKKALGVDKIEDHVALIEDPHGYIVNKFWDMYAKDEPPHMDKTVFLDSKIPLGVVGLTQLRAAYNSAVKDLKGYAPTLTKTGLKSNLKKSDFDIILDPKKEGEFDAINRFMDAANELKDKYNASGAVHLLRFANGKIRLNNGHAVINPYDYAK